MSSNQGYFKTEVEFDGVDRNFKGHVRTVDKTKDLERAYTYEEAINMAGTGWYSYYLMLTSSVSMLSMCVDIFSFSVIVSGSRCEFPLDVHQKSALMSIPFLGPVIMSYAWGYLSDTRGRRRCLSLSMWGSFVASGLVAFSPHYMVSGALKFISSSFCSGAQSTTYALLGESSSQRARGYFMLMVTGFLNICFTTYIVPAFYILNSDISFLVFGYTVLPWRILALVLALPMGISAVMLHFVYESPKFLANAGRKEEAVQVLAKIWKRNGKKGKYPVEKLDFAEDVNISCRRSRPFFTSLWQQTAPLFKPPLLLRTLQLFYLTNIFYSISNSLTVWFPFIGEAFFNGLNSAGSNTEQGLCLMIDQANKVNTTAFEEVCSTAIEAKTVYAGMGQGFSYFVVMLVISAFAARKKMLMLSLLVVSCVCGIACVLIPNNLVDFVMFFGLLLNNLCMGVVFSYFVDLYPTSYRGMVSCLGTIVARSSSLVGINVIGVYFLQHCSATLYACTAYLFSGLLVSLFLPPDKPGKNQQSN